MSALARRVREGTLTLAERDRAVAALLDDLGTLHVVELSADMAATPPIAVQVPSDPVLAAAASHTRMEANASGALRDLAARTPVNSPLMQHPS